MDKEGGINIFRRKFFVSQCQKDSYVSPLVCHCFPVEKKFMDKRGSIEILRPNNFVSQ